MEVYENETDGKNNFIMIYNGVRVAFDSTEWLCGDLYLFLADKCAVCLDENSKALYEFEKNDFVIEHGLAD